MLNQNFNQVIVSNSPTLLAQGTTVNLAYGQVGIFDADTYAAVTQPNLVKNKGILIAQGTPDLSYMPKGAAIANETEKSKPIAGRKILEFRGKKAQRGQTQKIAIGYDGIDGNKTLSALPGQIKYLWVKLTGKPIENLYPGGIVKRYAYQQPCYDSCGVDGCTSVNPVEIAQSLQAQIEKDFLIASNPMSNYIRVSMLTKCTTPPTGATLVPFDKFTIDLNDDGSFQALANVQVQYTQPVSLIKRNGITSTYGITVADGSTPAAYALANAPAIPNCTTCPAGYTLQAELKVFEVVVASSVTDANITALPGHVSHTLIKSVGGTKIYTVNTNVTQDETAFGTAVTALAGGQWAFVGVSRSVCVPGAGSTQAWVAAGTCNKAQKKYTLTLRDDECGQSLLPKLKAEYEPIYGVGSVVETAVDATHCTRIYTLTIVSNDCLDASCSEFPWHYGQPGAYNGISWVAVVPDPTSNGSGCVAGLLFESALVARKTNKCYYDLFPYEVDGVHIQLSEHNPDWHGGVCETDWPVTELQQVKYPAGSGEYVIRAEERSRMYHFKYYPKFDIAVRQAEGSDLVTDPNLFYDQYSLVFDFSYSVLGWSDVYNDRYQLDVFFPEGQGKQFENAINGYVASVGLEPVVL